MPIKEALRSADPFGELQKLRVIEVGDSAAIAAAGRILRQLGASVTVCADRRLPATTGEYLDEQKERAPFAAQDATDENLRPYDVILDCVQPDADNHALRDTLDRLHERHEAVVTSVTPFGLTGPYAGRPANDHTIAAMSGLAHLTPRDVALRGDGLDQPPLPMPGNLVSNYAGVAAVVATLAGVYAQQRRARGQRADVSILETLLPTTRREIAYYAFDGSIASRFMRVWRLAPWGVKKCADGYFFVQVVEKHHWESLVEMMGSPAWALDPELNDSVVRYGRRAEVDAGVEAWIATQHTATLESEARERKLPFAPVLSPEDLGTLEQVRFRGFISGTAEHPVLGLPFTMWV